MQISFDSIAGNDAIKKDLQTALRGRMAQTILLVGAEGSDAGALAGILAAALLCTGNHPPCGGCPSCRKVQADSHPDLIVIDEGENEIKIELARRIREEASIRPNDGNRKVFLIHHADRMNPAAQNALLKVLEEPPAYAFFLLTAVQPGAILQTIRSRCTIYHLQPPESTESTENAAELLGPFLKALAARDEYRMMLASQAFSKFSKNEFRNAMSLLTTALRDAVLSAEAPACAPLLPELRQETAEVGRRIPAKRILALTELCAVLRERASRNANASLQCAALTAGAYRCIAPPAEKSTNK